jgi:hypothetical protein
MATHAPKLVPFNLFPWNNSITQWHTLQTLQQTATWHTLQTLQQTATYHLRPIISENSCIFSPARPNTTNQIQFNLGLIQPIYPGKKFNLHRNEKYIKINANILYFTSTNTDHYTIQSIISEKEV